MEVCVRARDTSRHRKALGEFSVRRRMVVEVVVIISISNGKVSVIFVLVIEKY